MFKKGFVWGVATAATQIEGGAHQDEKELTVWDVMSEDGEFIANGHTALNASNSYNLGDKDIELMKGLGVNAYRFSLSWARIIKADGSVNEKGLKHYSLFVDKLLKAGIDPYITLFHWDLPYYWYQKGGWLNREIAQGFKHYVEVVAKELGPKVNHFMTFNEPQCILGGRLGGAVQNAKYSVKDRNTMVHNLLLCHGEAVKVLRQYKNIKIGFAPCGDARIPLTNSKEDIEAARKCYFDYSRGDMWGVSIFSDPIVLGKYPDKYFEVNKKEDLPEIKEGDMKLISQPLDFYAQNIYLGIYVKSDGKDGYEILPPNVNTVYTVMNWPVLPEALYWGPKFLYERYHLPFYITENGCAVTDIITKDKKIHDAARGEFIRQYVAQLERAEKDGVDVRGYFVWSLVDNLEWYEGFRRRFGLVYVDFQSFERYPKDSFYEYKKLIEESK